MLQLGVEGIGLGFTQLEELLEIRKGFRSWLAFSEPHPDRRIGAWWKAPPVDAGGFGAFAGTDRVPVALHDIVIEPILV